MARPKITQADSSAIVKIENAFWKLLNESDYTQISVSRVCQEAGVNRNSFYYHYESIDALAAQAFRNTVSSDLAEDFLTSIVVQNSGISFFRPDFSPRKRYGKETALYYVRVSEYGGRSMYYSNTKKDIG